MRLAALMLLALPLVAQSVDRRGLGREWTDLGAPAGEQLRLDLEACGITVLPSEDGHLRMRYVGREARSLGEVRLRFEPAAAPARFRLEDTPREGFEVELQVPKRVDLDLHMSAGEVKIRGIEGSKQVRLGAGEIRIEVGDPSRYGPVSASVWVGEVNPGPFGETKGGFFRSISHQGPGPYTLLAKVKTGEVRLVR